MKLKVNPEYSVFSTLLIAIAITSIASSICNDTSTCKNGDTARNTVRGLMICGAILLGMTANQNIHDNGKELGKPNDLRDDYATATIILSIAMIVLSIMTLSSCSKTTDDTDKKWKGKNKAIALLVLSILSLISTTSIFWQYL